MIAKRKGVTARDDQVLERGAILSERRMGTHPSAGKVQRFVDRGAPGDGGWARSFWRAGHVAQEMSFAPNQLIKQGAKLVTSAADVIEELPAPFRTVLV